MILFTTTSALLAPTLRPPPTRLQAIPGSDELDTLDSSLVSCDSSVTVLWTRDDWQRHTSVDRYYRHISTWGQSTVLRRLRPILGYFGSWALVVSWLNLAIPSGCLGYMASPLALLLTFRLNAISTRFQAGRTAWGSAVGAARNLAGTLAHSGLPASSLLHCRQALSAFGYCCKGYIRGCARKPSAALDRILTPEDRDRVLDARKPPMELLKKQLSAGTPLKHVE